METSIDIISVLKKGETVVSLLTVFFLLTRDPCCNRANPSRPLRGCTPGLTAMERHYCR